MKEGTEPGFMEKIKRVLPLAESTIANTFLVGYFLFYTDIDLMKHKES